MDEKTNPSNSIVYTADEISSYAAKNEMPDSGLTYIDWLLWYMLRDIYAEFRQGTLDKERGADRKKHAIEIWEKETFNNEQSRQLAFRVADLWKRVELAASQYQKDRTLENADLIIVALYGFMSNQGECSDSGSVHSSQDGVKGGDPS